MAATVETPAPVPVSGAQPRGYTELGSGLIGAGRGVAAYNVLYLGSIWIVIAAALSLAALKPSVWTIVAAVLLISSRQQALLNVEHEAVHRKLFSGRRLNDAVGRWLCAAAVGSPFNAAQHRHLTHHRRLATDQDPDAELHSGADKATRAGLARHFIGGLLGAYAAMILVGPAARGEASTTTRADLISLLVAQIVMVGVLSLLLAPWVYPLLWLAPLFTITMLVHLIRSFVEHAIIDSESPAHSNRLITIASNPFERALFAPFGMNYHAEHHLLPSVPASRLRRLHRRVRAASADQLPAILERRSYTTALWAHFGSLRSSRGGGTG